MPWLYALFILLFHLPACIIRAVRWESAQYLALGLAIFGVALTIQAYVSTRFEPSEVLVWMPPALTLDVGAMLQMIVLIIEKHGKKALIKALKTSKLGRLFCKESSGSEKEVAEPLHSMPLTDCLVNSKLM